MKGAPINDGIVSPEPLLFALMQETSLFSFDVAQHQHPSKHAAMDMSGRSPLILWD